MKPVLKTVAAATLAGLISSAACAAGFQLTEQSSLGVGRAYAGAGIVGDDLSAVHYNAAGMTLLPGTQFQAGTVWIEVNADFQGSGNLDGVSENGRYKGQAIPAGYITHQLTDNLWAGLGLTVPFGMGTDYDPHWAGSERGYSSTILTFDINPNVAWKVNDFLSVGGGVSLQYAKAKLSQGVYKYGHEMASGTVNADSWDWGFNLGVMVSPSDTLRFGLAYRSAVKHEADGDFTLKPTTRGSLYGVQAQNLSASATVKTPDTLMLTATWEATENLRLSGLIRWAKWSNFKNLVIKNNATGKPLSTVQNDWEDTWLFSVGADYRLNSEWVVRCGVAYEKDPVKDATKRVAVIPDTDRLWLSAGATWQVTKSIQMDGGLAYLKGIGNRDLYSAEGEKIGRYDHLDAIILGLQAQIRF